MSEPASTRNSESKGNGFPCGCLSGFLGLATILIFLFGVALGPIGPGIQHMPQNGAMQQARSIGLLLYSYSNDNDGEYPEGKTSTEIFQKLIDGNYAVDGSFFYVPLAGKVAPQPGQKLKPENVSFDVTVGLNRSSPDELPVAFLTGYKINYAPGAPAIPVVKPYPRIGVLKHGFFEWLTGWHGLASVQYSDEGGIGVCYKGNNAAFLKVQPSMNSEYIVPNFISPRFKPDGKTYGQITPDASCPSHYAEETVRRWDIGGYPTPRFSTGLYFQPRAC